MVKKRLFLPSLRLLLWLLLVLLLDKGDGGPLREDEDDGEADNDAAENAKVKAKAYADSADSADSANSANSANSDRDAEEVMCSVLPPSSITDPTGGALTRNGLGDQSYFLWPDNRVPFKIGDGFNATAVANIEEAVRSYNDIFSGCLEWVERTSEPVYVEFLNSGSCHSKVGRAYWPFPLAQSISIGECSHLIGHIKHEMMHTLGFYHEHSRSDRDMYVDIQWQNIKDGREDQFRTYRWTTGYGERYDYDSLMHYSAFAFSKSPYGGPDLDKMTIVPKKSAAGQDGLVAAMSLGRRRNLSRTDVVKIKKMYKCEPFQDWKNYCTSDGECGINEYCSSYLLNGQCTTLLADGSFCLTSSECLNSCSGGLCTSCTLDEECRKSDDKEEKYCAYKYLPFVQNSCESYCGSLCLHSGQCDGNCRTCGWSFTCS